MRKIGLIAALFLLTVSLSATALAQGNVDKPCPPGCDCPTNADGVIDGGVMQAIEDHTEAVRVRESATAKEVIKEVDNVMGMTCYDKALTVTSKLGRIFSDKNPSVMKPANKDVFKIELPFPSPVSQRFLGENISAAVSGLMENYAEKNFEGSMSYQLGAGFLDEMGLGGTGLGQVLQDIFNTYFEVQAWLDDIQGWYTTNITNRWNSIVSYTNLAMELVNAIGNIAGCSWCGSVTGAVSGVLKIVDKVLDEVDDISQLIDDYQDDAQAYLDTATPYINAAMDVMTMISDIANGQDPCSRVGQLWNKGRDDLPTFKPVTGGGVSGVGNNGGETGIPYLTVAEMLTDELTSNPPQNILDFLQGITNDNDGQGSVLQRAVQQFSPGGVLSKPGDAPNWTKVPTVIFNPGATINDIRSAM